VKTPKRELLKIIFRLKSLFGDNTNKGGAIFTLIILILLSLVRLVGENTKKGIT
jgi:hypothetical protein